LDNKREIITMAAEKKTKDKIYTTLRQIKAKCPCEDGIETLVKSLGKNYGEDTPITFEQIYQSNGYDHAIWALRTVGAEHDSALRHFAVDCAEMVKRKMKDQRSLDALKVAHRYADGKATDGELKAVADAARAAAWAAARAAARAATARAAYATAGAASAAAAAATAVDAAAAASPNPLSTQVSQMKLLFKYCNSGKRVIPSNKLKTKKK
jgi:hypothetical protein